MYSPILNIKVYDPISNHSFKEKPNLGSSDTNKKNRGIIWKSTFVEIHFPTANTISTWQRIWIKFSNQKSIFQFHFLTITFVQTRETSSSWIDYYSFRELLDLWKFEIVWLKIALETNFKPVSRRRPNMNRLCSTRIHSDGTYFRLRTQSSVNETERVRMMQLVIFKRVGPREHSSRDRVVKQYINVKTIRNILDCETFRRIVRFDSTPVVVVSPWRISVVFARIFTITNREIFVRYTG